MNLTEKIFCIKPQYLDDFKCDGAKCNAKCCRSEWAICVDATTYEKYSSLPQAQEILRHLRGDKSGEKYFIEHEGEACPFLGADNLCRIQKTHGEDYLSQVCASYPRIVTRFENFFELALSLTCPVAAKIILLRTEPLRFEVAEASEKILRFGVNNIVLGIPHDFAPLIVDVQFAMVSILQERRLTLDQRLIVLEFFLERIEELFQNGELDGAAIKDLSSVYLSENFLSEDVPLMLRSLQFMPDEKILSDEFATVAENFLVNEIFLNVWPFRVDAGIVQNFELLRTAYRVFAQKICDVQSVDKLLNVAGELSRLLDHDEDYLTELAATLKTTN